PAERRQPKTSGYRVGRDEGMTEARTDHDRRITAAEPLMNWLRRRRLARLGARIGRRLVGRRAGGRGWGAVNRSLVLVISPRSPPRRCPARQGARPIPPTVGGGGAVG